MNRNRFNTNRFRKDCPKPELFAPYESTQTKSRRGILGTVRTVLQGAKWAVEKLGGGPKPTQKSGQNEPKAKEPKPKRAKRAKVKTIMGPKTTRNRTRTKSRW
jgi:hypothetical protein